MLNYGTFVRAVEHDFSRKYPFYLGSAVLSSVLMMVSLGSYAVYSSNLAVLSVHVWYPNTALLSARGCLNFTQSTNFWGGVECLSDPLSSVCFTLRANTTVLSKRTLLQDIMANLHFTGKVTCNVSRAQTDKVISELVAAEVVGWLLQPRGWSPRLRGGHLDYITVDADYENDWFLFHFDNIALDFEAQLMGGTVTRVLYQPECVLSSRHMFAHNFNGSYPTAPTLTWFKTISDAKSENVLSSAVVT